MAWLRWAMFRKTALMSSSAAACWAARASVSRRVSSTRSFWSSSVMPQNATTPA